MSNTIQLGSDDSGNIQSKGNRGVQTGQAKRMRLGLVVDKSSSMDDLQVEVINGFNDLIWENQTSEITTVLFGTETEMLHNGAFIDEIDPIDETTYRPYGNTALLDGIGKCLEEIGGRWDWEDTKSKVMIAIMTDGYENWSRKYSQDTIARMIRQREGQGWEFLFISPKHGEFFGKELGIKNFLEFSSDPEKFRALIKKASKAIKGYEENGFLQLGN